MDSLTELLSRIIGNVLWTSAVLVELMVGHTCLVWLDHPLFQLKLKTICRALGFVLWTLSSGTSDSG